MRRPCIRPVFMQKIQAIRKYTNSIHAKIFLAYGFIFSIMIILATSFYYFISYHNFLNNRISTSAQLSKILSSQVTNYVDSLNSIQKRILESDSILEYIFESAQKRNVVDDLAFRKSIYSVTGYDFDFYHMNILNLKDNTLITFGQEYAYKPYTPSQVTETNIIKPTLALYGAKNIIATDHGNLYAPNQDSHTLSICRAFSRYSLSAPKAVIEIQINYERIQKIVTDNLVTGNNQGDSVLIFDRQKQLIYPLDFPDQSLSYYSSIQNVPNTMHKNPYTNENEIITSYYSKDTGFTTMLITSESYIVKNKSLIRNTGAIFCMLSFLLLTFITYKVAQSITSPLKKLKNNISSLSLEDISDAPMTYPENENYNEFEHLTKAYVRMQERLKKSLDEIIAARTMTIHSQLLALQAQMDSHFLYNTLTIISIIAEENNDAQASGMCIKLTEMLRYITDDGTNITTFQDELHHAKNYTDLMAIRFGDRINFQYITDHELNWIEIPRLLIQPIIENSVKYSRNDQRILCIIIRAYLEDGFWKVCITDNGDGFTDQALKTIQERIQFYQSNPSQIQTGIDGLGLINIYIRLKLFYSDQFLFHISNRKTDGCITGSSVTIGGIYRDEFHEN